MLDYTALPDGWELRFAGVPLLRHTDDNPVLQAGIGSEHISMHHGNFEITDEVLCRFVPESSELRVGTDLKTAELVCRFGARGTVSARLSVADGRLQAEFTKTDDELNRFWLRLPSSSGEAVWGCGEQFSHFNLRGRNFPLWTREQGVGRNKETLITQMADRDDHAGGDYHTTFYPQTSFVSSARYFFHAWTYAYADFDFRNPGYHELCFWELPPRVTWSVKDTLLGIVQDISLLLGRQPELPDWIHDGVTLGIQDGTSVCLGKLDAALEHGVAVNGIWAQDWVGQRFTSFGKRLKWNWVWDKSLYPDLDRQIPVLKEKGVRFLGYINPYVLEGHSLYQEALEKGYLGLNAAGKPYLVDFGEFSGGIVDFTNPGACTWYKSVIRREMIDFGLSGWMADFGEYLPTDVVLFDGTDARIAHNMWPGLWARINREAIEEAGKQDEIIFFMRAGNAESLRYCPMMWAGDQNVDWTPDDGLPSVITSALSLAMSGMGLQHSDIGGYTTLYSLKRSKELFLRWAEFAACTPMMRTHEGNRPADNWQFDSDGETLDLLARSTRLFTALKPYRIDAVRQNAQNGIPVMRPIMLHYEGGEFRDVKDEYLLGRDVLVAPVMTEGAERRTVLLPGDDWIHVWTGERYSGGRVDVDAPLGKIPLFYRASSPFSELFSRLADLQ